MIIKKYPAPPIETAASRYDRDWLHVPVLDTAGNDDDRHDRTLLQQTVERKSRRYVDDNVSAVTGGSPVFDPNEGVIVAPVDPNILWTDNFEGPELNERWTVMAGTPLFNPLRSDDPYTFPSGITLASTLGEAKRLSFSVGFGERITNMGFIFHIMDANMESFTSLTVLEDELRINDETQVLRDSSIPLDSVSMAIDSNTITISVNGLEPAATTISYTPNHFMISATQSAFFSSATAFKTPQ